MIQWIVTLLTVLLVGLKLTELVTLSWLGVLAPVILYVAVQVVVAIGLFVALILMEKDRERGRKW